MKDYSTGDLMAAILSLQEATAAGFTKIDAKIDSLDSKIDAVDSKIDSKIDGLRHEMNRRFDSVDKRFDRLTGHVLAIEQRLDHPAL